MFRPCVDVGKPISIDVVVPTYRVNVTALSRIISLEIPRDTTVAYYIVIDKPGAIDPTVQGLANQPNVILLVNGCNRGTAFSRNRGFQAGSSDFVLFVDDDVTPNPDLLLAYREMMDKKPYSPGYAGTTRFSPASNSFTKGMQASEIPNVWKMAETYPVLAWNVSSNLMVCRGIAEGIQFLQIFPKRGGGEDIDYGLRLTSKAGRLFVSVPEAVAEHGWWSGGARQYRRLFRWGYGDSWLGQLHPQHRFFTPPNLVETLFLGTALMVVLVGMGFVKPWTIVSWGAAITLVEFVVEMVRLSITRKKIGCVASMEATLIRLANDFGRLAGNIGRGRLAGFMERFDYSCTRGRVRYELRLATVKFAVFLTTTALVLFFGNVV